MGSTASPCSPSGETCLHQAAALGQRTICHYIVEAGASLMKTDQQVSRPAGWAGSPRWYNRCSPRSEPLREGSLRRGPPLGNWSYSSTLRSLDRCALRPWSTPVPSLPAPLPL